MVIESEIAAFEIMKFVIDNKLPIGVNLCNLQFKNRFQRSGLRKKMSSELIEVDEEITENGFIRKIEAAFEGSVRNVSFVELEKRVDDISQIKVTYTGRVLENLCRKEDERLYFINEKSYPITEGLATNPIIIQTSLICSFIEMINSSGKLIPEDPLLFEAWKYEFIEEGMREYF